MYEFQYRLSFTKGETQDSDRDYGDRSLLVFGIPVLRGDGPLVTINLGLGDQEFKFIW